MVQTTYYWGSTYKKYLSSRVNDKLQALKPISFKSVELKSFYIKDSSISSGRSRSGEAQNLGT